MIYFFFYVLGCAIATVGIVWYDKTGITGWKSWRAWKPLLLAILGLAMTILAIRWEERDKTWDKTFRNAVDMGHAAYYLDPDTHERKWHWLPRCAPDPELAKIGVQLFERLPLIVGSEETYEEALIKDAKRTLGIGEEEE